MPRILKPGKVPVPDVPWQMRVTFVCGHCGCEWQADRGEWYDVQPWVAGDAGCAAMNCPTCGTTRQIREPGKPIARGL